MTRNLVALFLFLAGLLQMAGDLSGVRVLRGIGAATAMAPFPRVFSDVNGLETFASEFTIIGQNGSDTVWMQTITPELYSRLEGPYNRRNVYGAALAYAPRLPGRLWEQVFCFALLPGGPLRKEFGIPDEALRITVVIRTKTHGRHDSWSLSPPC